MDKKGSKVLKQLKIKYHKLMIEFYRISIILTKRLRRGVEDTDKYLKSNYIKREEDMDEKEK